MDVFKLSRDFFDWSFENPEKITPTHSAIFFFAIEHCNRLWWKEKFWLPTSMVMEAIWIRKWETYSKAFKNLVEWWFITEIEKSKNQYSSCIISIWSATPKNGKALGKALAKHGKKHGVKQGESTGVIDIQETKKQETIYNAFENFYKLYPKHVNKKDAEKKFKIKCKQDWEEIIFKWLRSWIAKWNIENTSQFIPAPDVWLNKEKYNDELWEIQPTQEEIETYKETNKMWEKYDIVQKYYPEFIIYRSKWKNATEEDKEKARNIREEFEIKYNLK